MLSRTAFLFVIALAAAASPSLALAELNIAPGAHATASGWHEEKLLVEKRDAMPRNAVDGSLTTGWRAAEKATGRQWLQLDFTRPWPVRFGWRRLVTHWDRPPASYRWEVSRDGLHWALLSERFPTAATDSARVSGEGAYLRIVLNEGESASLLEVETYAGAGGAGSVKEFTVNLDGNRATLRWNGRQASNVFLYRATRSAGIEIDNAGGQARVTSLVAEGPITQTTDRVEFPTVGNIRFAFTWALEAYAPNGERIGEPVQSPVFDIVERSLSPFTMRGVVEGYYGPGYSHMERADLIRFVGMHGGNFYLYGPKLDPFHRERWREPYPAADVAAFAELVEHGLAHGVTFAWSLSPGLDYKATPADDEAAIQKFLAMHAAGVRWFALFMDDIPVDADANAAVKQVALANKIHAALQQIDPETKFIFVPTVYCGDAAAFTSAQRGYLEELANLHPAMYVAWTGTGVFVPTMTRAQMEPIAELVRRPLVLWDNLPVADFFLGRRLNLGPLEGRAADLASPATEGTPSVFGYLANPMWLPAANRLSLATVFDYLLDPGHYFGDVSLGKRLVEEAPRDLRPVFERWVDAFRTNPLVGVTDSTTTHILAKARAALAQGQAPDSAYLEHAAALYIIEPALADLHYADLAGDLLSAARDTGRLGEAMLLRWQAWTSTELTERSELVAASETLVKNLSGWIISEGESEALLKDFGAEVELHGAPVLTGALPKQVVIGRARSFRFDLGGATGKLLGLPGATMENGVISWTPGHTGAYRWVVLSTHDGGTQVKYGSIRVVEVPETEAGCQSSGVFPPAWVWLGMFVLLKRHRFLFTRLGVFR